MRTTEVRRAVLFSDTNPSFDLLIAFAGGIPETVTGLVRFGWRDYESASGRWLSRDPILFRGRQANLYVYIANTPTNYRDPSGLWYFDLNVSYGTRFFLGWTGGMLINDKGIYPYFGGGIVSPQLRHLKPDFTLGRVDFNGILPQFPPNLVVHI
ncbi:MAG: hypothetical protein HY896_12480 [Deltaproteobacteria bacterium]|nr:hypothetical protein [Deltaproteobacteria bacterium]